MVTTFTQLQNIPIYHLVKRNSHCVQWLLSASVYDFGFLAKQHKPRITMLHAGDMSGPTYQGVQNISEESFLSDWIVFLTP